MGLTGKNLKKNGQEKRRPGPKQGSRHQAQFVSKGNGKQVSLNIGQRLMIMDTMEKNHWSQLQTAAYFSNKLKVTIQQENISRWLPMREEWKEATSKDPHLLSVRKIKPVQYPLLEEALAKWVFQHEHNGILVHGEAIVIKAM
ncbi:hypothetical protein CPB86DRAFT_716113 [Serendipita vermifera]|nr:hypothetical protein CPB86DRAFT_716113 [Serendipita vermifera]